MMRRLIEEHLKTLDVKAPRDFIGKHRRTEGGATVLRPPPFWDILLRISQKQLIFLNIRPPPF